MFTLDIKALNTNLAFIKRATGFTPSRGRGLPAEVRLIRISVWEGVATVGWFDYEVAVEVKMPAEGSGSALIDVVELTEAIKMVGAKGKAAFTLDGNNIRIDANGVQATATNVETDDLPDMPSVDNAPVVIASGEDFAAATLVTASSVGRDHTLPMLTGIRFEGEAGGIATLASTDRFRLAVVDLPSASQISEDFAALIPGKVLTEFGKASAKAESVSVSLSEGFARLESDNLKVTTRLLDAEFPRFRQLLPDQDNYTVSFKLPASAAAKQLKAVSKARQVRLEVLDGVTASTETATFSLDAGELTGDEMLIAFNPEYLAAILASAPAGQKVSVNFTAPSRPAVIEWDGVRALLMPVRLPG